MARKRIGDLLLDAGLITQGQLNKALKEQQVSNKRLGAILVEQEAVSTNHLMHMLSQRLNIRAINLSKYKLNPSIIRSVPEKFARENYVIPIEAKSQKLIVAMSDPTDYDVLDQLIFSTGYKTIVPVLASDAQIEEAINKYYAYQEEPVNTNINVRDLSKIPESPPWDIVPMDKGDVSTLSDKLLKTDEATGNRVTHYIINEAVKLNAKYIHLDPIGDKFIVALRVNGKMQLLTTLTNSIGNTVINKLRIQATTKFSGKPEPLDGQVRLKRKDMIITIGFHLMPVKHGNRVVLSIDKKGMQMPVLSDISFSPSLLNAYKELINQDKGVIIVTGPHDNGKTTSLYATMSELGVQDKIIFSYEDAIRTDVPGVVQVDKNVMGSSLDDIKAIFRQNPDVLVLTDLPDTEALRYILLRSQSDILVLIRMDGMNSFSALDSMQNMDIPLHTIAMATNAILCQRLLPKLCEYCKRSATLPFNLATRFENILKQRNLTFYERAGCNQCNYSGYDDLIGVYELLIVDKGISEMILRGVSSSDIIYHAVSNGMVPMQVDALQKAATGLLPYKEVMKLR